MKSQNISMIALLAAMTAGAASAQTNGPTASKDQPASTASDQAQNNAGGIEEIVVTAQRRSESLQKVPITVEAVTQQSLQASGVVNASALSAAMPSVVIQQTYAGATPFIRGVGSVNTGFTAEQPVATYIDGVYLPNAASGVFAFNNIDRIEVLKGPQGTLFGRNAVGGLINIVTKDPSFTPQFNGSVGYGNYNTVDASGYVSSGFGDKFAADFSALYHDQMEGWGRNLVTGDKILKNREYSFASKLVWLPTNDTKVTLRGLYDNTNTDQGAAFGVYPGSRGTDGTPYYDEYTIANVRDPSALSTQENVGLKIEQDFHKVQFVSISGYNHTESDVHAVQNGIPGAPITGESAFNQHNAGKSDTYTQEVQLLSEKDAPFQWILGAFYMHDHFTLNADVFPTCVAGVCAGSPTPIHSVGDQTLQSYAIFGEGTIKLPMSTRLTLGLRETQDDKDESKAYRTPIPGYSSSVAVLPGPNAFGQPGAAPTKASFSKLTWRAVLAHDFTPSVMGYLSVNRGFKAGAYNPTSFANPIAQPEVLDAFEAGLKSDWYDHKLRLNVAAFAYDYTNIQLRTGAPPAPPGQTIVYNAAGAHEYGLDADLVFKPTNFVTFNASTSLLDAKFSSFPGGACTFARTIGGAILGGAASTPCSLKGYTLPLAPKLTANVGMSYRIPTRNGDFIFNVNDAYNGGFYWGVDNRLSQSPYHLASASLSWNAPDNHTQVQLYVHNLGNAYYFVAGVEASGGVDDYSPGAPRTFGIKLSYKY